MVFLHKGNSENKSHTDENMLSVAGEDSNNKNCDPVLGLNVGGKVFYCCQSTLTSHTGSYFAARFGGRYSPGLIDYCDEHGHKVYFVDRNPAFFEHVLEYLRTNALPGSLPTFGENPGLWRSLRTEAEFFGLDGLSSLLQVTHSCPPDEACRGVLYWLGTDKGTREYQNPFTSGAIHVGGWVDLSFNELRLQLGEDFSYIPASFGSAKSRASLVQYHLTANYEDDDGHIIGDSDSETAWMLWCGSSGCRCSVTIDTQSIMLRPTHYSLRHSECYGMEGDWNFEASVDRHNWDVLHMARDDNHIRPIGEDEKASVLWLVGRMNDEEEKSAFITSYMEKHHRHTWTLEPAVTKFYRHFRIIGADTMGRRRCLHGAGLELFGDVYQE